MHQVALDEASKLKVEVRELRELQNKYNKVCLEISGIKSKHAEEMESVRKEFEEGRARLIREATEERGRLNKMLGESEEKNRHLDHCVRARDEKVRWHQAKISQLQADLSQLHDETEGKQKKINDLRDRVEQVRADKLRALSQAEESAKRVAQLENEVKYCFF